MSSCSLLLFRLEPRFPSQQFDKRDHSSLNPRSKSHFPNSSFVRCLHSFASFIHRTQTTLSYYNPSINRFYIINSLISIDPTYHMDFYSFPLPTPLPPAHKVFLQQYEKILQRREEKWARLCGSEEILPKRGGLVKRYVEKGVPRKWRRRVRK